eukprot:TRINITY_DN634_c0_g1_i4.p1 TRINITY_DN634_c0_g1~~TRINITY_DN634_c0_g1_i4.p1  ORF type:complete len:372 (-),score=84.52 TRINITY_DN634_c0_g1_i4:283-1398(-)
MARRRSMIVWLLAACACFPEACALVFRLEDANSSAPSASSRQSALAARGPAAIPLARVHPHLELRAPELRGPPGPRHLKGPHAPLTVDALAGLSIVDYWRKLWEEERYDLFKVLLLVVSNMAYLLPARFAFRRKMFYKAFVFCSVMVVSGIYHAFDTGLLPREQGGYLYGTQPADFLLAYYSFVMMALLALGPEDEEKQIVRQSWAFLWLQRMLSLSLLQYLLTRSLEARFDVVHNIPPLALLVVFCCGVFYGPMGAPRATSGADLRQLCIEGFLGLVALCFYALASDESRPYWVFHSMWHTVTALVALFLLASRAPAKAAAPSSQQPPGRSMAAAAAMAVQGALGAAAEEEGAAVGGVSAAGAGAAGNAA